MVGVGFVEHRAPKVPLSIFPRDRCRTNSRGETVGAAEERKRWLVTAAGLPLPSPSCRLVTAAPPCPRRPKRARRRRPAGRAASPPYRSIRRLRRSCRSAGSAAGRAILVKPGSGMKRHPLKAAGRTGSTPTDHRLQKTKFVRQMIIAPIPFHSETFHQHLTFSAAC